MKKLIHFIALMVVTSVFVKAQHVVTNAADEFTQPSFSLNWTLGEPVCETYPVGTNFLTQGFQQPGYEGMVYSLQTDSLALVALYNATDGPNWINNSNWLITPVENWFGITITDGRVTGIKIKFNNLLGVLPSDIGNLSMLTYLNFRGNQLSGSIPPQLWNLQNLWTLDLGQNNFSGSIPHLIGNLNELRYLYLIANQFTGTIPDPLWGLTNLELIQISGNFLEGEISENIGNLPNLWLFDIAGNNFSGTLPEELYSMTQLTCLSVGWNDFTGPLDMKLCTQLINLNYLSIEYCYFGQESCDVVNCLINRGGWEWFEHSPQNNGFTFPNDCSCEDALADAGENIAVCDETSVELNGSAVNATSIMWATEGDGMFDDATLLNATYTLGPMDMDNGYAILCLEAYASPPCLDNEDCMEITFQKSPTNYVGPDATICEGEVYTFDMAWAENYSYIQWYILNGLGDFDNESILHPTYYPSPIDYLQGMITIGMWAEPINPCVTAAEDFMELYFSAPPEVYLGNDFLICSDETVYLDDIIIENYASYQWDIQGDGELVADDNFENVSYTPGPGDITNGFAQLCLTAYAYEPCENATACINLNIQPPPTNYAGPDATICEGETYTFDMAWAENYSSIQWFTWNGAGIFINEYLLHPTYYPSPIDYLQGMITIGMWAEPINPCVTAAEDFMELYFSAPPEVYLGNDFLICSDETVYLDDIIIENYASYQWDIQGDGELLADDNFENVSYTPGPGDIENGFAQLCLTAYAYEPCEDATACINLYIQPPPTNYAGQDATICGEESYTFDEAWAENYSSIQWFSLNGAGIFINEYLLHPTYYPSPIDYLQGMITIGMWAEPINPCVTAAEDFMELYFSAPPEVYLGNDFLICSDETVYLDDIIIENYASYQWDIQGDGELLADDNFDNVSYTPGSGDIQNGFAQLCLTAIANEGCENATDCISINIQPPPTNYVGPDATICGEESYTFDEAWAENYSSIQWFSLNGAGIFINEYLLHPTYYPSPIDYLQGMITIGMWAEPINPCVTAAEDFMELYFSAPPEVYLGNDFLICSDETVYLDDIIIENYASYQWDIQGDGELLADDNFENVSYTPGPGDIENGFAQLCLTAYAWEPYENITDCIDLYIQRTPTIYAGRDATIWHGETYTFDEAWAEDYQAIYWNCTNCGGYFDNYTQLNPTYTPSPLVDYFQGMINIVMIAEPINPCTFVVEDYMNLYFVGQAIEVPGGWSGISSYIQAPDGNIDNLFEPYLDKLEVLSNFSGIFYPGQNINTLGIFNYQSGYQIKASEPFALTFSGFSHEGANLTKGAGWSIIPVLTSCMVDIEELFQNNQSLVIVKEVAGPGVYWPEYQINTLHHLKPGKAYYTLQNATETIDFPDCENQWLCGQPLVECRDGQFYKTVQIGGQCWMAENLNTGLRIDVALNQTNNQLTEKYCYNDDEQNCNTYGALYQWEELMKYSEDESTQGICPPTGGWHIPSTGEWKILEGNADSQFNPGDPEWDRFGFRGIDACGNLKEEGFDHWLEPNMGATNLVGFRAFASGSRSYDGSEFKRIGKDGLFWSSSFDPNFAVAITHRMYYDRQTSHREYLVPSIGLSVRCIKDEENPNFPPVKPHTPNPDNGAEIQSTSLTLSWQCSDPESEGLSYSIYFGDAEYPPLAESNLSENSYLVTGLDMNTTYYWRIVAKDPQNNTSESFVWHFSTTDAWQCGQLLFDEHDGQSYQTVPIGDKCWMAENLNIGTMVSNSSIQTNNQIIEKYCYDEDTQNCETYGGLYSWDEMMKYSNLEGGQGICPPTGGWHVATDDEWKNLEGSVDSQYGVGDPEWDQFAIPRGFDAGGNLKETGFDHWLEPNTGATNSSGFSGLPGSYGIGIIWGELGESAYFWTSSKYEDDTNWSRSMSHLNSRIGRDPIMQSSIGLSVRCVKDAIPVKVSNNKF